jgi:hypothetical protein
MAIVATSGAAAVSIRELWNRPQFTDQTSIPLGTAYGICPLTVPAKLAADQSKIHTRLTMPSGYNLFLKALSITATSGDLVMGLDAEGYIAKTPLLTKFPCLSDGVINFACLNAMRIYTPRHVAKNWYTEADTLYFHVNDVSAVAQAALTFSMQAEFWVYGIEQSITWPMNSPTPIMNLSQS